jgi:hypothetical protein
MARWRRAPQSVRAAAEAPVQPARAVTIPSTEEPNVTHPNAAYAIVMAICALFPATSGGQ